jgi:hypothetical protein
MPSIISRPSICVTPSAGGRQNLNALDRVMWCVDRALRGMRYPGFMTQTLVWLSGRLDAEALRHGIARLSRRYPVIAARLIETSQHDDCEAYWGFREGAVCPLRETWLVSPEHDAVLDVAGQLLSEARDPTRTDPLSFHLLHRPDGHDVFLMQYNHMLMDNGATGLVLRLIDWLSQAAGEDRPEAAGSDPIRRFLRSVPYTKRRAAVLEAVNLQGRVLRGRAAVLGKGEEDAPRNVRLRIATCCLAPEETDALRTRVVSMCGFPSLSMGILASVFRAIAHLAPHQRQAGRNFVAGIGLDLNLRNGQGPLFQNLMSLVPISAQPEILDDREKLVRFLSHQMRQRLDSRIDLGALQVASVFSRRPRYIRWVVEHLLRYATSLWYAYFGSQQFGQQFCGALIEEICYAGPTWSPVGLTLLVNQFQKRLLFQATYDPELVPPPLADEFLQCVLGDLKS